MAETIAHRLGARSRARLAGVNPALVKVVERAIEISSIDFAVIEGIRSIERQRELLAGGHTRTMRSRHITGHAVDLAPWAAGGIDWANTLQFRQVGHAMRVAALDLGVALEWGATRWHGGSWVTFNDMPHFQLSRRAFPAEDPAA